MSLIWNQFRRKIYIDASIDRIYQCWATAKELETWFLRSAIFLRTNGDPRSKEELAQANDGYIWTWHNWESQGKGRVTLANGKDNFQFTFDDSKVTIELDRGRDMTLVTLTQEDIAEDEQSKMMVYFGCSNGWTFWLANLKAYLEHGVLLHDTRPDLIGQHDGLEFVNM